VTLLLGDSGIETLTVVPGWVKLTASAVVLGFGVVVGIGYLRGPFADVDRDPASRAAGRPWRRLGAAICVVVAVMFVLGIYLLDGKPPPRVFLAYWILVLVLVFWLCGLAFKDLMHTRRLILARLDSRRLADPISGPGSEAAESEDES
jgi:hypothetical protein